MTTTTPTPEADTARTGSLAGRMPRGPVGWLLNFFSSIWLGVTLLSLLFIYSSIGSAYPPLRQMRIFEMTEFEWFHYWPFNLLIALICINLVVATLRRIPFKPINYGVWMIHSGIIILALGSVWYFGTKVEGDAIVGRRMVTLELPGAEPVSFAAQPGRGVTISGEDAQFDVQVANIDPQWELLSGPDKGVRAYSVTLNIHRRGGDGEQMFMRQLIAGFPQYTEDIVRTSDHTQPMQRAKTINPDGDPLVDTTLSASLEYDPQEHLYLVNSSALYLREVDAEGNPTTPWIQRRIDHLPRYHEYISDYETVWLPPGDPPPPLSPLDIEVSAQSDAGDPLAGQDIVVTDYLRYAVMDERRMPGGGTFDPVVSLELASPDGRRGMYDLVARDPQRRSAENGELLFVWVDSQQQLDDLREAPGPKLTVRVPGQDYESTHEVKATVRRNPDAPFIELGDTGYSFRVQRFENDLFISEQLTISVAMLEIQGPNDRRFLRMVRSDGTLSTDFPVTSAMTGHEQPLPLDASIEFDYQPAERAAAVTVIAGPQRDQLHLLNAIDRANPVLKPIEIGESVDLGGATLTIRRYASNTQIERRPSVIARNRRDKDVGSQLSMIRVAVPTAAGERAAWLPFHLFPFESEPEAIRRFRHQPARILIDDKGTDDPGDDRAIELVYSRQRQPLPAPVVLEDFVVTTHTGGLEGTASIRNWTSVVRFASDDDDSQWGERREVSVNDPIEHDGYWFFQSQWDAPDPPRGPGDPGSRGMNYTVLGVGNRNGVNVMLAGCCVAVIGMMYSFYWKPVLRRRKILKVQREVAQRADASSRNGQREPAEQELARTLESVSASESEQQS